MLNTALKFLLVITTGLLGALAAHSDEVILDGKKTQVTFNDGDTFKIKDGAHQGSRVRIAGFNALETYMPVQKLGDLSKKDMAYAYYFDTAHEATRLTHTRTWTCHLINGRDTYGRLLAQCDDLAIALIEHGVAHAYSVDHNPAQASYLAAQKSAQQKKLGLWKYGVPKEILTSIHSRDEGEKNSYDRAVSSEDGSSRLIKHQETRKICQEICLEGSSCMIFVPFNLRYGPNKPNCFGSAKD